jgi:hypothetical protein
MFVSFHYSTYFSPVSKLKCEMIWKIWKNGKLNSEKDMENAEKNCEMVWKIWKKIVKCEMIWKKWKKS